MNTNLATPVVTIGYTPVKAAIFTDKANERSAKLIVRHALSYTVDTSHMSSAHGRGWDGTSSFLEFDTGRFPSGFIYLVYKALSDKGYRVSLKPVIKDMPCLGKSRAKVDNYPENPDYEYQHQAVEKVVKFRQCVIRAATGAGKSRIAMLLYKRISRPTLFLTTRGVLFHQMAEQVEKGLKEKVGYYGDGKWSKSPEGFNVGTVQTFAAMIEQKTIRGEIEKTLDRLTKKDAKDFGRYESHLERKGAKLGEKTHLLEEFSQSLRDARPTDKKVIADAKRTVADQDKRRAKATALLEHFELIISEEAHEASGNSYYNMLQLAKRAVYRCALTGTPFMRESQEDNMRLMACSGQVALTVTEKRLIDCGILAKPFFKYVKLEDQSPSYEKLVVQPRGKPTKKVKRKLYRSTSWPACYDIGIVNNAERNKKIVAEIMRARLYGLTAMVLVTHKEHGNILRNMLTNANVKTSFIYSDHDQKERKAAFNALANKTIDVLIGTSLLDVGVDVPAVGMIVLAGAGKAEIALRQRIGRGLRAKKTGPNVALVVDFEDRINSTLSEHYCQRAEIIKQTPGFCENIVTDFDYRALGFEKAS